MVLGIFGNSNTSCVIIHSLDLKLSQKSVKITIKAMQGASGASCDVIKHISQWLILQLCAKAAKLKYFSVEMRMTIYQHHATRVFNHSRK